MAGAKSLKSQDQPQADFYNFLTRTERGNHEYRQLLQHAKLELKKSKRKDYYKILGVERGATEDEIKRAYRKRALVHHPGQFATPRDHRILRSL